MATNYPNNLDVLFNPVGTTLLGSANADLRHSLQHSNVNDAIEAIQAWIGVSGSNVSSSIEFRLHKFHDHDGINSVPVALGPDQLGNELYTDGIFTLSSSTKVGHAIDKINRLLSSSLSGSTVTFKYEGNTLGDGGLITEVDFIGTGVSASYVGNQATYYVSRGLIPTDRSLILLADSDGPMEGYNSSFHECVMHKNVFLSASTWYTDSTKTTKIYEQELIYENDSIVPSYIYYRSYEPTGNIVVTEIVDTIFYNGIFEVSRSRMIM